MPAMVATVIGHQQQWQWQRSSGCGSAVAAAGATQHDRNPLAASHSAASNTLLADASNTDNNQPHHARRQRHSTPTECSTESGSGSTSTASRNTRKNNFFHKPCWLKMPLKVNKDNNSPEAIDRKRTGGKHHLDVLDARKCCPPAGSAPMQRKGTKTLAGPPRKFARTHPLQKSTAKTQNLWQL